MCMHTQQNKSQTINTIIDIIKKKSNNLIYINMINDNNYMIVMI
jgi:hypothetical protein